MSRAAGTLIGLRTQTAISKRAATAHLLLNHRCCQLHPLHFLGCQLHPWCRRRHLCGHEQHLSQQHHSPHSNQVLHHSHLSLRPGGAPLNNRLDRAPHLT